MNDTESAVSQSLNVSKFQASSTAFEKARSPSFFISVMMLRRASTGLTKDLNEMQQDALLAQFEHSLPYMQDTC